MINEYKKISRILLNFKSDYSPSEIKDYESRLSYLATKIFSI